MSKETIIALAVLGVVLLGAILFVTMARRSDVRGAGELSAETIKRDRSARKAKDGPTSSAATAADVEAAGAAARRGAPRPTNVDAGYTPWTPPDRDQLDVSRRQFFNRAIIALMGAGFTTFAAASFVGFLWPSGKGGFGGKVPIGKIDDVKAGIQAGSGFYYTPDARSWITAYPLESLPKAEPIYAASLLVGMKQGLIASYQKCPHLGCRVPSCPSSQWFECGCHGSQYNRVGEKKGGPAPRGMDHFPLEFSPSGDVFVNTVAPIAGMAIGTNTTGQEAEGPHCVGATH